MSISRKNWSALSSLARQWTMEDEEEVERERRRRVKSSSSIADPDDNFSQTTGGMPTSDSALGTDSTSEMSQGLSSVEQIQLDFVEMLRVRDEKRRMRHVEMLRQQKEVGEDEAEACSGGGRVELLGDMDEEQGSVLPSVKATSKPQPPPKTASYSPTSSTNITNRQHENGQSSSNDRDPKPSSNPPRKFVSSVSISLDKSPSASGCTSPMSPHSPTAPYSPREHWPSPCQSPSPRGAQSPAQNGHTQEMMRKKEEESAPLQRSASVRLASKKFESNTNQNEDEDKASPLQRNSRQRISSRSIQEKMERLAQAAQKSEIISRSPDVTQRTLFLLDEVSRKRGLFEKEKQGASPTSPGVSRQEFRSFTSGMSDRINRWVNKTNDTGSSLPTDLRHVDIIGKRSLFETREENSVPKPSPGKICK
ncbi:ladinin-1 isoform X2 [Sander lucioperca]|uniref:ladinin-1 isoform X2 n=1 Tax=Sander lucioperca TaxID=283035 RepID=UPI00125E16AF|nr:ladinin-1 isoform X2 [Sander lucioperca]